MDSISHSICESQCQTLSSAGNVKPISLKEEKTDEKYQNNIKEEVIDRELLENYMPIWKTTSFIQQNKLKTEIKIECKPEDCTSQESQDLKRESISVYENEYFPKFNKCSDIHHEVSYICETDLSEEYKQVLMNKEQSFNFDAVLGLKNRGMSTIPHSLEAFNSVKKYS